MLLTISCCVGPRSSRLAAFYPPTLAYLDRELGACVRLLRQAAHAGGALVTVGVLLLAVPTFQAQHALQLAPPRVLLSVLRLPGHLLGLGLQDQIIALLISVLL